MLCLELVAGITWFWQDDRGGNTQIDEDSIQAHGKCLEEVRPTPEEGFLLASLQAKQKRIYKERHGENDKRGHLVLKLYR